MYASFQFLSIFVFVEFCLGFGRRLFAVPVEFAKDALRGVGLHHLGFLEYVSLEIFMEEGAQVLHVSCLPRHP